MTRRTLLLQCLRHYPTHKYRRRLELTKHVITHSNHLQQLPVYLEHNPHSTINLVASDTCNHRNLGFSRAEATSRVGLRRPGVDGLFSGSSRVPPSFRAEAVVVYVLAHLLKKNW